MASATAHRVPVALSASTDTEEGRAFFQERLGLYAGWVFVLSGGFFLLDIALHADLRALTTAPGLAHLGGTLAMGAVWAITRGAALGGRTLAWLDVGALIITCAFFAFMGRAIAVMHLAIGGDPMTGVLIGQLACASTVLVRAVAVPSTSRRTLWLGIAALAPQVALPAHLLLDTPTLPLPHFAPGAQSPMAIDATVTIAAWCAVAISISTVGSRVIFGLRAEASKVRRLGQYTLEEKIGEGGMGVVYRASHAMLRRPTAIKLLPPEKAGEESIGRFEREVQLTAQLTHPSTVAIFDYGRTPTGLFYYAMEFLDGLNLEELVRADGPQRPGRVLHILEQVAGALTEAHEAGIIHRDLKPANIILCQRGGMPDIAKVVDFGLVKRIVPAKDDEATMLRTAANVLTGTPLYMAPEAVKGDDFVDGRSDLYALGAVGYFLLAGAPVFKAGSVVEVIAHHLHTIPAPVSERSPFPVPADLDALIMRCLAKNPNERFATARELVGALHASAHRTPWSIEEAEAWWNEFTMQRHGAADRVDISRAELPTLAIDLDERTRAPVLTATASPASERRP
jgi:predicted Ser/Thr protein kinase